MRTDAYHDAEYHDAELATDLTTSAVTGVAMAATGTTPATATTAVASLLQAAGASAAVPYAGWIVAGAIVIAAGIIAFVGYIKRKGIKVSQVAEIGKAYGFPQAAAFPDFILDGLNEGPMWRKYQAKKLEERLAEGKGQTWIDTAKLQFLGIVEAMYIADKRRALGLPPVAPTADMVAQLQQRSTAIHQAIRSAKQSHQLLLIGGGLAALVVAVLLTEPKKKRT